jgi:hypothetical protein
VSRCPANIGSGGPPITALPDVKGKTLAGREIVWIDPTTEQGVMCMKMSSDPSSCFMKPDPRSGCQYFNGRPSSDYTTLDGLFSKVGE